MHPAPLVARSSILKNRDALDNLETGLPYDLRQGFPCLRSMAAEEPEGNDGLLASAGERATGYLAHGNEAHPRASLICC